MHYGLPEKILSDQGCNFESRIMAELCEISKVKKLHTTYYRLQCNGQCDCFNVTLISMIGTLPIEAKSNWQEQLPALVHAYNCSCLKVTGFSPFYLMYWRQPMLPLMYSVVTNTRYCCLCITQLHSRAPEKIRVGIKLSMKLVKRSRNIPKSDMIKMLDAVSWNLEILSLSDKKYSKGNIKSVIDGKNSISCD